MKLVRRIIKWGGAVICILLLVLFVYSTRRAIIWTSPSLEYETSVMLGTFSFACRPEGWSLENEPYAGHAGWSVASVDGAALVWWFSPGANRAWRWVTVPLWLPALVVALPAGLLWYCDRRGVRRTLRRAVDWLRPVRRKRMTFLLVAASCVIHVVSVIVGFTVTTHIHDFFSPSWRIGGRRFIDVFFEWTIPAAVWGTPLWGSLWAWLYVRVLNSLGQRSTLSRCFECGYDLTGNVSGVCSECGEACESGDV